MNASETDAIDEQSQQLPDGMASQNEDLYSDEPTITSSLQAGINYCRYMSEQMFEEIKKLQVKLDSTCRTKRVLKQNSVDLENEKQRLIFNFQEDFRKFNNLNTCVRQLDEELFTLKEFLELSMQFEEDICQSKVEELKLRTNIQSSLEEQEIRLQKIESSILNEKKKLMEKFNAIEEYEIEQKALGDVEEEMKSLIHSCDKKMNDINSTKNLTYDIEELKLRISSLQIDGKERVAHTFSKWEEFTVQVKTESCCLRSRSIFSKDRYRSELEMKENTFKDMNQKIESVLNQSNELDKAIAEVETAIKCMMVEKECNAKERAGLQEKLLVMKQEECEAQETIHCLSEEIRSFQEKQSLLFEEQKNLQDDLKQMGTKKEILIQDLNIMCEKSGLLKKLNELRALNKSYLDEEERLQNEMNQLFDRKEKLEKESLELECNIQNEKQRICELQKIIQTEKISQNLVLEEETKLIDQLRLIRTEEFSLAELKETELNALSDKFKTIFADFTDMEFSFSQMEKEYNKTENELFKKKKIVKSIIEDNEFFETSIQHIKQNVYNGAYVTMQELNKKYNMMVNGKNIETERVDKLKQEIANLKTRLNIKKDILGNGESSVVSTENVFFSKGKKSKK